MLDGEAVHVVRVHDVLDSLVVVEDGQSRHFVEFGQVLVVAVATLDELITRILQRCPLHGCVSHDAHLTLLVGLLSPVGALGVVEVLGDAKLTMENFALVLDLVLYGVLTREIVVVIVHGERVVLN